MGHENRAFSRTLRDSLGRLACYGRFTVSVPEKVPRGRTVEEWFPLAVAHSPDTYTHKADTHANACRTNAKPAGRHARIRARMPEGLVSKTDFSPWLHISEHLVHHETLRRNVNQRWFLHEGGLLQAFPSVGSCWLHILYDVWCMMLYSLALFRPSDGLYYVIRLRSVYEKVQ